ncbi:MAG: ATP-binding protein [Chitinophagales bacterium]
MTELLPYTAIFDNNPIGMLLFDQHMKYIVKANPAFANQLSYSSAEELNGQSSTILLNDSLTDIEKSKLEILLKNGDKTLELRRKIVNAHSKEIFIALNLSRIENGENGESFVLGIIKNLGQEQEFIDKLITNDIKYNALVKNFPNGTIALFDREKRYLILGGKAFENSKYQPEKMLGKTLFEAFPDYLSEKLSDKYDRVLAGEEFEHLMSNGEVYHKIYFSPVHNFLGEVLYGLSITVDVTREIEFQKALEEKNKSLEEKEKELNAHNEELKAFAYSISHDLKSPLRAIKGFMQILLKEYPENFNTDMTDLMHMIRDNAQRMDELINDILKITRVGSSELISQKLDLNRLVKKVWQRQLELNDSKPEFEMGTLPKIMGDEILMQQIFDNLLSNAIKYSSKKDKPKVRVMFSDESKSHCIITVKDNGVGFDPKYKDRIFGLFKRLHHQKEFEGNGLGLAIVERIVQRHNGKVWADSKIGKGTSIHLKLPKLQ